MSTVLSLLSLFWVCLETSPAVSTPLPPTDSLHVSIHHRGTCYLYKKIKHRLEIKAAGVGPDSLEVTCDGCRVKNGGAGHYSIYHPGPGEVLLTIRDRNTGKTARRLHIIEPIEDPVLQVGAYRDGAQVSATALKAEQHLKAIIHRVEREVPCYIVSYTLVRSTPDKRTVSVESTNGYFLKNVVEILQQAKTGDQYTFKSVLARCPGDAEGRPINGLTFTIR